MKTKPIVVSDNRIKHAEIFQTADYAEIRMAAEEPVTGRIVSLTFSLDVYHGQCRLWVDQANDTLRYADLMWMETDPANLIQECYMLWAEHPGRWQPTCGVDQEV